MAVSGFFDDPNEGREFKGLRPRGSQAPDKYLADAKRLRDAVVSVGKVFRKYVQNDWARYLEWTAKCKLEGDEARYDRLFEFYVMRLPKYKELKLPQAFSGEGFANKIDQIAEAEDRLTEKVDVLPVVELSEDAKYILKQIRGVYWPEVILGQIPDVVQKSVENYQGWRSAVEAAALGRWDAAVRRYLLSYLGPPDHYLVNWFTDKSKWMQRAYVDGVEILVWDCHAKWFQREASEITYGYTQRPEAWGELKAALRKVGVKC